MTSRFADQRDLLPSPVSHNFTDHVFASPHGVDLELRVWPARTATLPDGTCGWALLLHGGGYASGSHYAPPSWTIPGLTSRGIHVVSAAYRLLPHAGLADEVEDCIAAYDWCRKNLPGVVGGQVDVDKCVVGGESAGGTLSTLLGLKLSPPPKVVIDIYGNVDLLDPRHWNPLMPNDVQWSNTSFPQSLLVSELETRDPTKAVVHAPFPRELASISEAETQKRWAAPAFTYSPRVRLQTALKEYLDRAHAHIFYLLRLDELPDDAARKSRAAKWSPTQLIDDVKAYPPTAFLHGTGDAAVNVEMSKTFANKLREKGVPVVESYEDGAPHAFDMIYWGPQVAGWDTHIVPVLDFVEKHLSG